MATENATRIGEKLGKLLEIDDTNTKGVHFCKFLRIRVEKGKIKYGSSSNIKGSQISVLVVVIWAMLLQSAMLKRILHLRGSLALR